MKQLLVLICLASPACADTWQLRNHETVLTTQELTDLTANNTLVFYDDGQSKYSAGGAYSYTYANNGGTAFGHYDLHDDGSICIAYRNGFSRCDLFVHSKGRIVMITQKGERFPIRP